jgi:hypothetical protein
MRSDGTVWGWGGNWQGQLGYEPTEDQWTPVQTVGPVNVVAIFAGGGHGLAVESDGSVWSWGSNWYGHLGDGTMVTRAMAMKIAGLTDIVAVAAGHGHSVFLTAPCTALPAPTNAAADPAELCGSGNVELSAAPGAGGDTVEWFVDGCGMTVVGTGSTLTVAAEPETTYFARTVDSATGCVSDECVSVVVSECESSPPCGSGLTGFTLMALAGLMVMQGKRRR